MDTRKTSSLLLKVALFTSLIAGFLACSKEEEPAPVIPKVEFTQLESKSYGVFPWKAKYKEALESEGLTVSTTVKTSDGVSSIVARWYYISPDGTPNVNVHTETLLPQPDAATYTSTLTLDESQFNTYFANHTFKQSRFYCLFSANSIAENYITTKFASDTVAIAMAMPAGLKVLRIDTVNGEEPTCDYASAPAGNNGAGIRNCTKVPGRLQVTLDGKVLYDTKEYKENESGMTLKIRGNTSAYGAQKPYKIKLQKKHDLMERGDEKLYEDKDWILLKGYANLNTYIGFECAKYIGFDFVPTMEYVNVIVNDDYRGLYCLVEPFDRNEKCRVKIKETGFIIEKDAYWWNEDKYFDTGVYTSNMKYTFKYPDLEDLTTNQYLYIQLFAKNAEQAVKDNGDYSKYIDTESFARWLLFHDIWATLDCAGSNIYMEKKDMTANTKIQMLSPWDFDSLYWNGQYTNRFSNQHYYGALLPYFLLASSNREYVHLYKDNWNRIHETLFPYMYENCEKFIREKGDAINASRQMNKLRWGSGYKTVREDVTAMNTWLDSQIPWLDKHIPSL